MSMSAIEALPVLEEVRFDFSEIVGEGVEVAADPDPELFVRAWESGPSYDRTVQRVAHFVSLQVITKNGQTVRTERQIDELRQRFLKDQLGGSVGRWVVDASSWY